MTIAELIRDAEGELAEAGVEDPRVNAELLLGHVLGRKRLELQLDPEGEVTPESVGQFHALVTDRATRRPLQYVLGNQEFMGLLFQVTPDTLVPRVDTEILVDAVIQRAELKRPELALADIGTGCGAIGLSLAHYLPDARVFATDVSSAALEVARRNAEQLELANRVTLGRGDLLAPLREWKLEGSVDVITANLPYVPHDTIPRLAPEVSKHEPRVALDGGADGLDLIRRFVRDVPAFLHPSGFLAMEIGYDQAQPVDDLVSGRDWCGSSEVLKDLSGKDRVVLAYGTDYVA